MSGSRNGRLPESEEDHRLLHSSSHELGDLSNGAAQHSDSEIQDPLSPRWRNSKRFHHGGARGNVAQVLRDLYVWIRGPQPPRPYVINPILPHLQEAPSKTFHRYVPEGKRWLLLITLCSIWVIVLLAGPILSLTRCQVPGYGIPTRISCVSRFW